MTDSNTFRMIEVMREQERAARDDRAQFYTWSESDVQKALDPDNAEVRRLTTPAVADPEVERLSRIAAEVAPKN